MVSLLVASPAPSSRGAGSFRTYTEAVKLYRWGPLGFFLPLIRRRGPYAGHQKGDVKLHPFVILPISSVWVHRLPQLLRGLQDPYSYFHLVWMGELVTIRVLLDDPLKYGRERFADRRVV